MAKKMNIDEAHDEEIKELAKDVHPEKVMDTIDKISKDNEDRGRAARQ